MKLDTELKKQEAETERERMKQEGQNERERMRERSRLTQDRFKQIFDQYSWKCLQTIKGYGSKKNKNSRTRV